MDFDRYARPPKVFKVKKRRSKHVIRHGDYAISECGLVVQASFVTTEDFLKSYEWRKVRMQALVKHGNKCQCCGASPDTGAVMNVDHIKPRKTNPELALSLSNLQVLCDACNHGKGNWDQTDWRK